MRHGIGMRRGAWALLLAAIVAGCASASGRGATGDGITGEVARDAAAGGTGGGLLLVLNKASASAWLLDPRTGDTVATFATGEGPHEVAVSPDGRTAAVANYGGEAPGASLTLLDLERRTVAGTVDLRPLRRPHGIAWLPDGERVVVTAETDSAIAVVDVRAGRVLRTVGTGARGSHMLALAPDAGRLFVANLGSGSVSVVDLRGRALERTIATGAGAEGVAVTPDGSEVWVTNRAANTVTVLDARSLQALDTLASADFPIRVSFTPDGATALVTNARSGELRLFDRRTRRELGTVSMRFDTVAARGTMLGTTLGETPGTGVPIGVLVSPDGRTAYVANANVDAVTVVDIASRRITGYLATGREPDGLGWVGHP